MVLSEFFFFIFFFILPPSRFRMITFDRQAGPLQNFNRSHVMAIGRSVSFSDPARPPGGGVGHPKHPKSPPPPPKNKFLFACVSKPQEHFWKKNLVGKKLRNFSPPPPPQIFLFICFLGRFKTPGTFLSGKFFSVKNSPPPPPPPPPPARPRPVLRTLTPILVQ